MSESWSQVAESRQISDPNWLKMVKTGKKILKKLVRNTQNWSKIAKISQNW
jgi:ribosomal protein S19E (S16A)